MKFEHNIVGGIGIRVVNDVKSVYKTIMGRSPDDVNVGNYGMLMPLLLTIFTKRTSQLSKESSMKYMYKHNR